jgi:ribonuclease HII
VSIRGTNLVAGVDEAGRGPLAGPVVAAAVVLPVQFTLPGLTDSKRLSEVKRQSLEIAIKEIAIDWSVAEASIEEIDDLNILQATMLAMQRAVAGLKISPQKVLVDGNHCPIVPQVVECIVKGDLSEPCISAASILAKQARDRMMMALDILYPQYGFARHKAYPTAIHRQALIDFGACPAHRRSFKPVREALQR